MTPVPETLRELRVDVEPIFPAKITLPDPLEIVTSYAPSIVLLKDRSLFVVAKVVAAAKVTGPV